MSEPSGSAGSLVVEPPAGYGRGEATLVLAGPGTGGPGDRKPNLVVRTTIATDNRSEEERLDQAVEEIRAAGGDMARDIEVEPFTFADEHAGRMVSLVFSFRGVDLRQRHAVRADGERVTTLTLTADISTLSEDADAAWRAVLGSARPRT